MFQENLTEIADMDIKKERKQMKTYIKKDSRLPPHTHTPIPHSRRIGHSNIKVITVDNLQNYQRFSLYGHEGFAYCKEFYSFWF